MRDHGGNLDEAIARHGGAAEDWLDLSTGINRAPYPVGALPQRSFAALPTGADMAALATAARAAYGTRAPIVPLAGASAAIALAPLLATAGVARVVGPTYSEHAAALRTHGWAVKDVPEPGALAGADLAVVVNPNNPDGRCWHARELLDLARDVGLLIVDESFVDPAPDLSLAPHLGPETERIVVQRSFGKFYGLAGLRLGFALTGKALASRLAEIAGPWPVSGPAIAVGIAALSDQDWQARACRVLAAGAARLDAAAEAAGWRRVGGTALFGTYDTGDGAGTRDRLAASRIWTRAFPDAPGWLRLGLPGSEAEWARLGAALR